VPDVARATGQLPPIGGRTVVVGPTTDVEVDTGWVLVLVDEVVLLTVGEYEIEVLVFVNVKVRVEV
jgi:hypothetical protein